MKAKLLKDHYPQIFEQLDIEKTLAENPSLTREALHLLKVGDQNKNIWWRCPRGDDHRWASKVSNRVDSLRGLGIVVCRYCLEAKSSRLPSSTYNLRTEYPEIAEQWSYEHNYPETPETVSPRSKKKFFWVCPANPAHLWPAQIGNRTGNGTGCPKCSHKMSSKAEVYISYELMLFLGHDPRDHLVEADSVRWDCDIVDRKRRLIIEYDGGYFHTNELSEYERRKEDSLRAAGWTVFRARERPLAALNADHVVIPPAIKKRKQAVEIIANLLAAKGLIDQDELHGCQKCPKLVNSQLAEQCLLELNLPVDGQYRPSGRTYPEKLLTEDEILSWADLFKSKYGHYPTQNSPRIPEMQGNTWATIDAAMRVQGRGLRQKGGLSQFLGQKRGYVPANGKSMSDISLDEIIDHMVRFRNKFHRWPTYSDQSLDGSSSEKWSNINSILSRGGRGLRGRLSLLRLVPLALRKAMLADNQIQDSNPFFASPRAVFGEIVLDLAEANVYSENFFVDLSSNQYIMLCILAMRAGCEISWSDLAYQAFPPERREQKSNGKQLAYRINQAFRKVSLSFDVVVVVAADRFLFRWTPSATFPRFSSR
jgi:hypothetical protein